jgi:hypothetical protein
MKLKYGKRMTQAEIRKMLLYTNSRPECWVYPRYTKARAKRELAALQGKWTPWVALLAA